MTGVSVSPTSGLQVSVSIRVTKHPEIFYPFAWPTSFPASFDGVLVSSSSFPTPFPASFQN